MALDGVTISNIVYEIKEKALGGRIDKIYQPEKDEIVLSIRSLGNPYKLLLTANPSHPRIHFTKTAKSNPMQAPLFCMVLRKHIGSGKIIGIEQPDFERIVRIHIESFNELGDLSIKTLIIEIMGKHSNIILIDDNSTILDSAKHISYDKSSVRQILPGLVYNAPPSQEKINPMLINFSSFSGILSLKKTLKISECIYKSYNGISPVMANEICNRASVDPDCFIKELKEDELQNLYSASKTLVEDISSSNFQCEIIFSKTNKPIEFASIPLSVYNSYVKKYYSSVSEMLEFFYSEKDSIYRIGQKTADLKKIVQQNIERCIKKKDMYTKTLREIKNRDTLKVQGELITANIYTIEKGQTTFTTQNFYDEKLSDITISLDPNLSAAENAQKYFKKYNKEKRTFIALQDQIKQNQEELNYLEEVLNSISSCFDEADIEEIRDELFEQGFVKKRKLQKGQKPRKSKPLHFKSSDGFDIYVGKNNKQNDELTMKFADATDYWFHTKEIPGSHVIIKANGQELPTSTLTEGAALAAYYSKARNSNQVPVDYTTRRNVKKPNGAKPGFVIYDYYNTAYITPSEELVKKLSEN